MTSRYEAYMDNVSLSSLDDSILVLDIRPGNPTPQIRTNRVAKRNGAQTGDKYFEKSSVEIVFEIHEYSISDRMEICQKVQKWANGNILETNDRTGQRLVCVCEEYPTVTAKDWTEPISMTFSGYCPPFWEDKTPTTKTLAYNADPDTVNVPGNAPETLVSATVTASEAITSMSFTVDGHEIELSGLSVASGDTVTIGYTKQIMYVRHNNSSILDKVTAQSADVLKARCGTANSFAFSADGSASCVFSVRGCWY